MAEETTVTVEQDSTDDQPQAGTNKASDASNISGQEPGADKDPIAALRSEAASWRVKYQNAKKQLDSHEEAKLGEMEKLQKRLDAIMQERDQLKAERHQALAISVASKAQALYPDAVARLIPQDAEDFEAAVKEIKKQYPAMFRQSTIDAGANGKAQESTDMNAILRQAIRGGR